MSDTPRTDKALDYTAPEKMRRLAEKMEREIVELKAENKKLEAAWDCAHKQVLINAGKYEEERAEVLDFLKEVQKWGEEDYLPDHLIEGADEMIKKLEK